MNKWLSVVKVIVRANASTSHLSQNPVKYIWKKKIIIWDPHTWLNAACTVVEVLPCLNFICLFLGKGARKDGQGPEAVFSIHGTRAHSDLSQIYDYLEYQ